MTLVFPGVRRLVVLVQELWVISRTSFCYPARCPDLYCDLLTNCTRAPDGIFVRRRKAVRVGIYCNYETSEPLRAGWIMGLAVLHYFGGFPVLCSSRV